MNENSIENNEQFIGDTEDEELLLEDENQADNEMTIDVSAVIQMAADFLQMDLLRNSVKDFGSLPIDNLLENPENGMDTELILITKEEIDKIHNVLSVMQKELSDVKDRNMDLYELIVNIERRLNEYWDGR